MTITRNQFLKRLMVMAGGVGLVSVFPGCGSSSKSDGGGSGGSGGSGGTGGADAAPDGSGASKCLTDGTNVEIGTNHGHVMTVSMADVMAGVDKDYDIMGTAAHTHTVTIKAADFAKLAAGVSAIETSSFAVSHMHTITVTCKG